jgi:hypothetical protein
LTTVRAAATILVLVSAGCADPRERPDADPCANTLHPCGISDEDSDDFHGRLIEREAWDLNLCANCHGDDFSGGPSGVTCLTCHQQGPTACDTCHDTPPATGAHVAHLAQGTACATCHVVPDRWDAEGHVRLAGAADPPPAEVTLSGLAAATLDPVDRAGPPAFDHGRHLRQRVLSRRRPGRRRGGHHAPVVDRRIGAGRVRHLSWPAPVEPRAGPLRDLPPGRGATR